MLKGKFESLRDIIKKEIISGKYRPGMNLPTEEEFNKTYGVNHSTINKAVSSLATEGYIITKPRSGSMVLPIQERKVPARLGVYVMRSAGHIYEKLNPVIFEALQRNHYFPLLINLDNIEGDKNVDWLIAHLDETINSMPEFIVVDGQAGFPFYYIEEHIEEIENLIFINRLEYKNDIHSIKIISDYGHGGGLAAKRLNDLGCKRILVALGMREVLHDDINISYESIKGFKKVFKKHGGNPDEMIFVARNDPDYLKQLKNSFKGSKAVDGIFSDSDFTAYKTRQCLNKLGIRHRQDYQMVGYFNTPWARETSSPFDSVSINERGISNKLFEIISRKNYEKRTWRILPELIKNE